MRLRWFLLTLAAIIFPLAAQAQITCPAPVGPGRDIGDQSITLSNSFSYYNTGATITQPRTWTLPPANTVNKYCIIVFSDTSGGVSPTGTVTLAPGSNNAGIADTINGNSSVQMNTKYGVVMLQSDGVSRWTVASGLGGSILGFPIVSNLTALAQTTIAGAPFVQVASNNGVYGSTKAACTAADGQLQVSASGGGCWVNQINALMGPVTSTTFNPYANVYPPNIAYPATAQLANNAFYAPSGTATFNNPLAFGDLQTSTVGNFTINSNRPGCSTGYTADSQAGTTQAFDVVALCSQADSLPPMWEAAGTFTSTTFVPTTNLTLQTTASPFGSPTTATFQSLCQVGMWAWSNDDPPFFGHITNCGTGAAVTVSAWYKQGSNSAGTPSGTTMFLNPQIHTFAFLPAIFMNALGTSVGGAFTLPTGTLHSGTKNITAFSGGVTVQNGDTISASGIPTGTVVTGHTATTLTISQNATSNATVSLKISATIHNAGANEIDISNSGPDAFLLDPPSVLTGGSCNSGSNTITGLSSIPVTVKPGDFIFTTTSGVPSAAQIESVLSSTSVNLTLPCTASPSGTVAITVYSDFQEGGLGFDISALSGAAQTGINIRGNFFIGEWCHGAFSSCFLVQPTGLAGQPPYGFRVDESMLVVTTDAYALTKNGTLLWGIDAGGDEIAQSVTVQGGGTAPFVNITTAAGTARTLAWSTASTTRWVMETDGSSESGANAGSNFLVQRYNDAGTVIDTPFQITRSTGLATFADGLQITGALTAFTSAQSPTLVLTGATPTVAASQVGLGNSTAGAASCGSLAGANGCLTINVAGTTRNIPFY